MIFDTDILIWVERGNARAARMIDRSKERFISVQTHMEIFQGVRSRQQLRDMKDFLVSFQFAVLPFTENIGHRASIYIEQYASRSGLRVGDALIAATAVENNLTLATGNPKDYRLIHELKLQIFAP